MLHKRKSFIIILICFFSIFVFSCAKAGGTSTQGKDNQEVTSNGEQDKVCNYSVDFIDVGEGDCIFIRFPDGKTMLIDTGEKSDKNYKKITDCIDKSGAKSIDYLMITHPDFDHSGNALDIIQNFDVGVAYIPYLHNSKFGFYKYYSEFYDLLVEKEISKKYSNYYHYLKGEEYLVAFLTPSPKGMVDGEYYEFNLSEAPTESQSNSLSPIIYVQICGVRFVFTGDAPENQEKKALENLKLNAKNHYEYYGLNVNLDNVDYLKISHHGSSDASCEEFLSVLAPKNAIISVGGNNNYGHPSSQVLKRLQKANENYLLYRTDVNGSISVIGRGSQTSVAVEISKN